MDKALVVWVVDDDHSVRWVLEQALKQAGMVTRSFERAELFLEAIQSDSPAMASSNVFVMMCLPSAYRA